MPGRRNPSVRDPKLYEDLRKQGSSKEKSARIANAAAKQGRSTIGRKGGRPRSYEDWTVDQLKERAKQIGMKGYSHQRKAELVDSLRHR